ncbi:MAG: STAS domain-containing protein [Planctomycetes bacterium]|nr:STAS domain-containing protein [Planctomycetota bacterium]
MALQVTKASGESQGAITLVLEGSLDSNSSGQLDKEIDDACSGGVRTLVLDMREVSFISSAGIGVIIKAKESLKKRNIESTLIHLQPQVRRVFEIMQLLPTLNVFASRSELDDYLSKIQVRIIDEGSSLSMQ